MTAPRTTRRRWLAGSIATVAGLFIAGLMETRGRAEWIGEVPPAEYHSPERQVFLRADIDEAVDDTLRELGTEIRQALEDAGVAVARVGMKPPEYRFAIDDSVQSEHALQIAGLAVPGAELEVAGAEIRVRLVEAILDRIRKDIVLKIASYWQRRPRIVLRMDGEDVEGSRPEIKIYVHESGCIRIDGVDPSLVGRFNLSHSQGLHFSLVPLYPTLDADSDHLPPGFSRLRSERKVIRPPDPLPQGSVLDAMKNWKTPPKADPEDQWRHIVGGRPIVTNVHFVDAEIEPRPSGPAVSLRLDVVGESRATRLLPGFQGRQFGLVVDNTVIGRFETTTKADLGITLVPDVLYVEAEALVGWLNDTVIAANLESVDACPATNETR